MKHNVQLLASAAAGAAAMLVLVSVAGFQSQDRVAGDALEIPFESQERAVSSGEVPEAALHALQQMAEDKPIDAFEFELRGGTPHYEGEWISADGYTHEATVTADGQVVETELDLPAERVPEAVRRTVQPQAGEAPVNYSIRTFITYEAEFGPEGQETELTLWPTGQVLQEERDQAEEGKAAPEDRPQEREQVG